MCKKRIAVIAIVLLVVSLTACAGIKNTEETTAATIATENLKRTATDTNPLEESEKESIGLEIIEDTIENTEENAEGSSIAEKVATEGTAANETVPEIQELEPELDLGVGGLPILK